MKTHPEGSGDHLDRMKHRVFHVNTAAEKCTALLSLAAMDLDD
jgi:hypothetical protein